MTANDSNSRCDNITVENLQDLLIYDDTFLDYFNVFLKLPVFPQQLEYQRLTDSFKIIDEGSESMVSVNPPFMASEEEHKRLLDWAQKYRLPLFLKTDLFRELKLSKLLTKTLENFPSSRETFIHGYSKQTNYSSFTTPTPSKYSDLSSKTNTTKSEEYNSSSFHKESKETNVDFDESQESIENNIPYDNYLRPGSRAISLPMKIRLEDELKNGARFATSKRSEMNPVNLDKNKSNVSEEFDIIKASRQKSFKSNYSDDESLFYRIRSAPLDFDAIRFESVNEEAEGSMIEELENIEGRQKISLQRLKEILIGTHKGMNEFGKFLLNTAGRSLCEFWLDCEQLKDLSAFRTEEENNVLSHTLMRNLKDKYKLSLTKSAKDKLNEAMKSTDKMHVLFLQAQYDILRRLRSYWLPRYIIHQESVMRQYTFSDLLHLRIPSFHTDTSSIQSGVFPKLILHNTLSYPSSQNDIRLSSWKEIMCFSNKVVLEPCRPNVGNRQKSNFSDGIFKRSAFQSRLRFSLSFDTASGCPFKNYLQNQNLTLHMKHLEFFQEVSRFKSDFSRNSDRVLRLSYAWFIVNKFLLSTGSHFIDVSETESKDVLSTLRKMKSSVTNEIFDSLIDFSVKLLQKEWLIYLKEDVKQFMESSITHFDSQTPPHSIDEFEVTIEEETIVVRRKLDKKEIKMENRTWINLSSAEKRRRREAALRLKEITEEERKRVLKEIKKRIKRQKEDEKRLKTMTLMKFQRTGNSDLIENGDEEDNELTELMMEPTEIKIEEKVPDLKRVIGNKVLLNLFKKYIADRVESLGRDQMHSVMLLQELIHYLSINGFDKATMASKDTKATFIYKSYLDKGAKKHVPLTEKINQRLTGEHERPKTPTFKEIQNHIYNSLTSVFNEFWKFELTELGVKSDVLAKMTEKELNILAENQLLEVSQTNGTKATNTAAHTKEDKKDFMLILQDASYLPLTLQILYFFNYLIEKGPEDKMNNLDKDLFFYVEVLKLKEICRTTADEDIAKKKIQCISSAFLESVYPPAVQINIPNDIAQQTIRRVQRQMTSKEINLTLFDEASYHCLKTLLPYWAGFQRQWEEPSDSKYNPISKYQRLLERRLKIYNDIPIPKADVISLPVVAKNTNLTTLSYTMNEGAKWKSQETGQDPNSNRQDGAGSEASKTLGKRFSRKFSKISVT